MWPPPSALQRSNATIDSSPLVVICCKVPTIIFQGSDMKTFIVACIAAAVIAIGAVVVLNGLQKPVDVAFTTSAVRI
jgi:hypothetical protein